MSKELTELWAKFGELSAQQEIIGNQSQQIFKQRQGVYAQITELKMKEIEGGVKNDIKKGDKT